MIARDALQDRLAAASVGMRVREGDNVYVCTRDIDPLVYPPSQVAAHFELEN